MADLTPAQAAGRAAYLATARADLDATYTVAREDFARAFAAVFRARQDAAAIYEEAVNGSTIVTAPFNDEQVTALHRYQIDGRHHPFTCPDGHGVLDVGAFGFDCPTCDYTQTWALEFMTIAREHPGPVADG